MPPNTRYSINLATDNNWELLDHKTGKIVFSHEIFDLVSRELERLVLINQSPYYYDENGNLL